MKKFRDVISGDVFTYSEYIRNELENFNISGLNALEDKEQEIKKAFEYALEFGFIVELN